jgi:hypothetical protein
MSARYTYHIVVTDATHTVLAKRVLQLSNPLTNAEAEACMLSGFQEPFHSVVQCDNCGDYWSSDCIDDVSGLCPDCPDEDDNGD